MENKIDDLTLSEKIGKGCFGDIFLSFKQNIQTKYATQVINKTDINDKGIKRYLNNWIFILKDIHHLNISKFIELKISPQKVYVVTEYYNGGNLRECLEIYKKKINKPFSEEIVQYIMRQIIDAMKYLHNKKIIHRNMKLDNIMIHYEDENDRINNNIMKGKIKITDFSFATYLKKGKLV